MSQETKHFYEFGAYRIDALDHLLLRDGEVVSLPPKTFDLLLALVESSGRVLTKEELMKHVWPDSFVEEANLSHHVFTLRKALGEDGDGKYIETIPRRGYRFGARVTEISAEEGDIVLERSRSRIVIEEESETSDAADRSVVEPSALARALPRDRTVTTDPRWWQSRQLTLVSVIIVVGIASAVFYYDSRADRKAVLPPMKTIPLTSFPDQEFDSVLSPDGKLVAFAWQGGTKDRISIYVKQVDAGTPLRLTAKVGRAGRPAWSPDGRYIAYVQLSPDDDNGIWMLPALGGPERKLYSAKYIGGLDWSSDGRTIAFTTKDTENQPYRLYLLAVDSLEVSRLTSPPDGTDGDYRPAFSPDGRRVAFLRRFDRSETTDVHVVSIGGGEPRRLTFDKRQVLGLAWTPDGKSLVFSSERTGMHRLWKMPASGGEPEELGIGTENAYDPSISRTGNRLTYTQILYDTNIWRMKRTGTSERADPPVKFVSTTQRDEFPRLSPDGNKMVFESTRSGSHELWLTDSEGTNPIQVTFFGSGATSNARWSPDGGQIAFESNSEEYPNIYVISAQGGLPRKITDGHLNSSAAGWSNDGRWIYFASNRGGTWEVWKVRVLGGDPVQVTRNGGYESVESSDGQFLYYNKRGYGAVGLFRIPVSGGDEDLVFDFVQMHSNGDWVLTNDGIYFIYRWEGPGESMSVHPAIKFVDFATHNMTTVGTLEKFPAHVSGLNLTPDGQWFIFASHDSINHDIMLVENFH